MQKKLLLILIVIVLVLASHLITPSVENEGGKILTPTGALKIMQSTTLKKSIFVPYWSSLSNDKGANFDSYYYFGIAPTKDGSIENEIGLQNKTIVDEVPEKQKKLVVRMLDSAVNGALLSEKSAQNTFISQTKEILSKNAFSGLVLDMEVPFTLQANKKEQITKFVQLICTSVKTDYKTCDVLVYGDFSYRNRPYDLQALSKVSDTILLMAYDLNKPGGEPGPNFNFEEKQKYGYDFKTMVQDVLVLVPKEKIEVVFGMYGYDWTLNDQGAPLKSAKALSVSQIKTFVANHSNLNFTQNEAKEKKIEYTDEEGRKHVLWYEDEESAAVKTTYLIEQGIGRVSFWAQSYF
ncbi:MAG: glycosyl hydrolase family 18 protein [Candidatus Roizmanbacteria bacterium]|nr:glycosyl hydrolase family 18 protein [Candidatus Roizmanbacteria bacterium]